MTRAQTLREVAWLFLRLGATAFGGPAAHTALMEDEVVRRRAWLTKDEFLDLVGATNLIPGPNSTELAIHLGHRRAGWPGLVVAGVCFLLPAFAIVSVIGWLYVRFGALPQLQGVLRGIKPVILGVVLQALWTLGRTAVKSVWLGALGVGAVVASALGIDELIVLFAIALLALLGRLLTLRRAPVHPALLLPVPWAIVGSTATATATATAAATPFGLLPLLLVFLKIGSVLFGSGYVLIAFVRADLVERLHWLTNAQLLDAVAVGQVTPGPLFTTATFVGYLLGGFVGGTVATIGIFLPAFVFVAISAPLLPRLRRSPLAGAFLDGLNVASLALMAVVTVALGRAALVDAWTVALAVTSGVLLIRFRVSATWLVLGGALLGGLAVLLR